jgi:cell division septation protein DedD
MKIICMDCQTESDVDPEMVKGKKHIECDRCAADFRAFNESKTAAPMALTASDDAGFSSDYSPQPLSEDEIQWLDNEDVLDISVVPFTPSYPEPTEADDPIPLALDETKALALFEEATPNASEQAFANHLPENDFQPAPAPEPVPEEPPTPVALAETNLQAVETAGFQGEINQGELNKAGLAAFSTPKLMTIAATFILFIAVAGMINSPVGKINLKAQSPAPAAPPPAEKKIEPESTSQASIPAKTSQPNPSTSPAVAQENISAAPIPPANQPVVKEPVVSQAPAATVPVATADGPLTIQVGSHNQMDLADSQAQKLRAAGYDPRVVSVEIPKRGRWYRVQVGGFSERREAQQFGAQLVSKGVVESFVIADK